jgi:hypothetical protein
VLGAIEWKQFPELGIFFPLTIALALSILFAFTAIMENKKFQNSWFTSRTIAEMIKRESWLYMLAVDPYSTQGDREAKLAFKKFLRQIVESETLPWADLTISLEGSQITGKMDEERNTDLDKQKEFYVQHRLDDQRAWYAGKAESYRMNESRLSVLMWFFLALGVVFAFINIIATDLPIDAVGVATTASAAVLSWIGAKSYRELAQSYSIVAHELVCIEEDAKEIKTAEELRNLVLDAEETMGQEHKLWKTKRLNSFRL